MAEDKNKPKIWETEEEVVVYPTLLNNWINYGGIYEDVAYVVKNNILYIRGLIKSGLISSATPVFVLDDSIIIEKQKFACGICNSGVATLELYPNGSVIVSSGSNTWVSLEVSFSL